MTIHSGNYLNFHIKRHKDSQVEKETWNEYNLHSANTVLYSRVGNSSHHLFSYRIVFIILKGWETNAKICILWHMTMIWITSVCTNKVLLKHSHIHSTAYTLLMAISVQNGKLSTWKRDHMPGNAQAIYYIALYRKSLPITEGKKSQLTSYSYHEIGHFL
jgi:hypothetical protein